MDTQYIELSKKLNEMIKIGKYSKEKVVYIHLFGIEHGQYMRENKISVKKLLKVANINESYFAEINKGINLSYHVKLK